MAVNIKAIDDKVDFPHIYMTAETYRRMKALVSECPEEIGWLALVNKQENNYLIYDVQICQQEVSGAHTDMHESGLQEIAENLIAENRTEELNNVRCWCHSHVNMDVTPSGTDESTFKEYYKSCNDYFIRLIMNKKDKYRMDLADYEKGLVYENIPFGLLYSGEEGVMWDEIVALENKLDDLKKKFSKIEEEETKKHKKDAKELITKHVKKRSYTSTYTNSHSNRYNNQVSMSDYYKGNYGYYGSSKKNEKIIVDSKERIEEIDTTIRSLYTSNYCMVDINCDGELTTDFISEIFDPKEIEEISKMYTNDIKLKYAKKKMNGYEIFNKYEWGDWTNLRAAAISYVEDYGDIKEAYFGN